MLRISCASVCFSFLHCVNKHKIQVNLRLAELITNLLEFERNGSRHIGSRFKCHTGRYGPQGSRTYCTLLLSGLWPYLSRGGIRLHWLSPSDGFCHSNPYRKYDLHFRPQHTRRTRVLRGPKW